ncbi:MAG: hypothetical protein ACUZ8N_08135 [Candidatus Scalindua sp.]
MEFLGYINFDPIISLVTIAIIIIVIGFFGYMIGTQRGESRVFQEDLKGNLREAIGSTVRLVEHGLGGIDLYKDSKCAIDSFYCGDEDIVHKILNNTEAIIIGRAKKDQDSSFYDAFKVVTHFNDKEYIGWVKYHNVDNVFDEKTKRKINKMDIETDKLIREIQQNKNKHNS